MAMPRMPRSALLRLPQPAVVGHVGDAGLREPYVDGAVLQSLDVAHRPARVDGLDADVGHQLRVALYECFAERPEVARREAGRQPEGDGLLGSGRLDPPAARHGEHQQEHQGQGRRDATGCHQNQRLLCATRAGRCQGIGCLVSQLVTIDVRSRPLRYPPLTAQRTVFLEEV